MVNCIITDTVPYRQVLLCMIVPYDMYRVPYDMYGRQSGPDQIIRSGRKMQKKVLIIQICCSASCDILLLFPVAEVWGVFESVLFLPTLPIPSI